jgi:antitoxin ParD1/3/4
VNDLVRRDRSQQEEIEWIRAKLIAAEEKEFTNQTHDEILAESKKRLRRNGQL